MAPKPSSEDPGMTNRRLRNHRQITPVLLASKAAKSYLFPAIKSCIFRIDYITSYSERRLIAYEPSHLVDRHPLYPTPSTFTKLITIYEKTTTSFAMLLSICSPSSIWTRRGKVPSNLQRYRRRECPSHCRLPLGSAYFRRSRGCRIGLIRIRGAQYRLSTGLLGDQWDA